MFSFKVTSQETGLSCNRNVHICVLACYFVCVHTSTGTHACLFMYVCVQMHTFVWAFVYVCVHAFVCLCVCVSICACVCVPLKHASVHSSVYAHVCKAYDFTPVYVYVCVSFNKRFPITATVSECLIL